MSDLSLLSEAQMRRIEPFFPLSHGIPRVDDRRILSGHSVRDPQRAAVAGCAGGLWAAQDDL